MIRTIGVVILIVFLFVTSIIPVYTAGECDYGSVQAWFRRSDEQWENATVHPVLKRGESFDIQVVVTTKTDFQVFFLKLHEFGTSVYEVIEGPTAMEQLLECRQTIVSGQLFSYFWKMRVRTNTTWVNGYGPLEVFVQFNKNDTNESRVNFDVITAFIVDQQWEKNREENITENISLQDIPSVDFPGFPLGCLVFLVVLLGIFLRVRQQIL